MNPKYEWLKVRSFFGGEFILNDDNSFVDWTDDIPNGWRKAFGDEMIEELNTMLVKYNFVDKYRIEQIKEKYGQLRWYDSGVPEEMTEEYYKWLNKYESLSEETCIDCGEKATHMTKGWVRPLCDKC